MNKENNRSAAGLRRSAIAERICIREEWSAMKGRDSQNLPAQKPARVVAKKNIFFKHTETRRLNQPKFKEKNIPSTMQTYSSSNVLRGILVLVDVGSEPRALALRATLAALGATVVADWSPLVTHLVWSQGGCRATRAKARIMATALVSPLWVEACAASNRRLPERSFPSATRPSDLPSPRTMRQILKKAEMENIPLDPNDSKTANENRLLKLRISSDTSTDRATDTSADTTRDTSKDSIDPMSRVNTAPRRTPKPVVSQPKKSRRQLFTQKEANFSRRKSADESDEDETTRPQTQKVSQHDRRQLMHTERITRRLLRTCDAHTQPTQRPTEVFRIVLTGMNKTERQTVAQAVRSLDGLLQKEVNKHTTHVILGSCREDAEVPLRPAQCARTLNALSGAARGCRVLGAQWALDSAAQRKWLHHHNYLVPHLKKIALRARVERTALGYQNTNYAYNVFQGMRVRISPNSEQRDAAAKLLRLCGAKVQDGGAQTADFDIKIGVDGGAVSSKWVFDSVASGRMRTVRRYVNEEFII